jgi:peptidoglycan/xylan/chitin deacetylase (PgdA/CDA1 family)
MIKKRVLTVAIPLFLVVALGGLVGLKSFVENRNQLTNKNAERNPNNSLNLATSSARQKETNTEATTPKNNNLSFEEMNKKFGPCARVNVLMYHHVQEEAAAKARGQTGLNVTPDFFRLHMQYLKDKGYTVISPKELITFFNGGTLPQKPVMITLDDGYEDNYSKMYPILKEFGFSATVFTATGLLGNQDYMTWGNLDEMKNLVYFGNHTWSHHPSSGNLEVQEKEIGTADQQLNEHGLNQSKIFAYPYGKPSANAETVLRSKGYRVAFTTNHGNILCKGLSLELPRIRVGNAPLNRYGL